MMIQVNYNKWKICRRFYAVFNDIALRKVMNYPTHSTILGILVKAMKKWLSIVAALTKACRIIFFLIFNCTISLRVFSRICLISADTSYSEEDFFNSSPTLITFMRFFDFRETCDSRYYIRGRLQFFAVLGRGIEPHPRSSFTLEDYLGHSIPVGMLIEAVNWILLRKKKFSRQEKDF